MNAVSLGPVVFDANRLAAVGALLLFLAVAELAGRLQRRGLRGDVGRWAGLAVLAWILGARAGFVAVNWADFAPRPWDALRLWQGGFLPAGGWAAGIAVFLLAPLRDAPAALRPLAFGSLAALILHQGFSAALPRPEITLPAIELAALDGRPVALAGRDRVVVVNLWATWCPPCRREMPMLVELAHERADIDLIFVNQGEGSDRIRGFLLAHDLFAENMLRDPASRLMGALRAIGLPSTLVFDAQGRLVAAHTGEISRAALNGMIDRAAAADG